MLTNFRAFEMDSTIKFIILKIPLIDGIVMGGGAGLTMHGRFRIVTEKAVFAMPEASIGLFPDLGASHFLSRIPGYFGEYLGLTGARVDGAEMLACGLATHFVFSKDLHSLENALLTQTSSEMTMIYKVIEKFAQKVKIKEDSTYNRLEIINKCFSKDTVEEILLAVIREGRQQNLKQCFIREYTICCNILRAAINSDLFEGSRAMLFDKDKKPKWEPPKLESVSKDMVDRCFSAIDEDDWEYLQLPSRSNTADKILQPRL
ncbi:hypothetical protein JCGZ_09240 [Jatropha curcas]|uniref:3-hydroxyisobutyryl-CoA hydrolase n=1 Tax=Jatropha curcas TaxID=180498 RepID=A0A067KFP6_JATCU|nr:hypothetical protein JCGZ_09240 [Jatropha curcas]